MTARSPLSPESLLASLPSTSELQPLYDALLDTVRPSPSQVQQAIARGEHVGQFLSRSGFCEDFALGGSVLKDTTLSPIKDVDVFTILDESEWLSTRGELYHPRTILSMFDDRLQTRYAHLIRDGHVTIRRQRRSVSVRFVKELTVNVDVVPVLRGPRGAVQVLERWTGDWTASHIDRQLRALDRYDTPKKPARDAIRLLKLWRARHRLELPSYALEVLVLWVRHHGAPAKSGPIFEAVLSVIVQTGLRQVFDLTGQHTARTTAVTIIDPAVRSANITDDLSASGRDDAVRAARDARTQLATMREIVGRGTTWGLKGPMGQVFGLVPYSW